MRASKFLICIPANRILIPPFGGSNPSTPANPDYCHFFRQNNNLALEQTQRTLRVLQPEEALDILRVALCVQPTHARTLAESIRAHIEPLGGVNLEIAPREFMRDPP